MAYTLALIAVALSSFATGLLAFRIKSRWCRDCGTTLRCPACRPGGPR